MSRPMKRVTTKTRLMFTSLPLKSLIWKRSSQLIQRWTTLNGHKEIKTLLYSFELIFFVLRFFAVSCVTHNFKTFCISFPPFFWIHYTIKFFLYYSRSTILYVKFYFVVLFFFFFLLRFKCRQWNLKLLPKIILKRTKNNRLDKKERNSFEAFSISHAIFWGRSWIHRNYTSKIINRLKIFENF